MTEVNCDLSVCLLNKDGVCTAKTIWLDEDHMCCGGCDEGWVFAETEDEEDEDDESD
jgi:hypothetical protein